MKRIHKIKLTARGEGIPLVAEQEPPTELRLFKAGWNDTTKGRLLFDEAAAKMVMAAYESRKLKRIAGDWEHGSLAGPGELADGGAPATCWFTPAVRLDSDGKPELWATDIKWTPRAYEQIKNGEYGYLSPAVEFETDTKRVSALINWALTNNPATIGQQSYIAASDRTTEVSSMDKIKDAMSALAAAMETGDEEATKSACMALAQALYDAGFDEPEGEELAEGEDKPEGKNAEMADAEGEEEKKELRALTGAKGKAAIAKLNAWRDAAAQVEALSARLAKLEGEKAASDFEAVIVAAKRDGKLSPAMLSDTSKGAGKYIAACRSKNDVAALSAYVEALPKIVNTEETPAPKSGVVALSDMEIEVAKKLGVDPEKLKASKAGK